MSYIALYRKWRPVTFDDVVEQTGVVTILKNAVKQDRIGHAYLFCGTRGTGKTTIAKIFSRAINCLDPKDGNPCNTCEVCQGILNQSLLDVMEIDAASNNGVDNVRDIIEEIAYVPTRARYKVYIIDEVHMLSTGAFNALLKTLEEPPEHAVFLLATTDPQKLPATILSRCQRFEFKRIGAAGIVKRLEEICTEAGVIPESTALAVIAQSADGALRDAISILDQCLSTGTKQLTAADVLEILGVASEQFLSRTAEAVADKNIDAVLLAVEDMLKEGKEVPEFIGSLIVYFRNILVLKAAGSNTGLLVMTEEALTDLKRIAQKVSAGQIIDYIKELSILERDVKWASQKKILLEVGLIKLCIKEEVLSNVPSAIPAPVSPGRNAPDKGAFEEKPPLKSPNLRETTPNAVPRQTGPDAASRAFAKLRPVEEENLRDIFLELKEGKYMMVMSYLRNVRALYYNETVIYLVFCGAGKEIKKQSMAKPENMKVIQAVFQKILDKDCVVKLYTEDELSETSDTKPEGEGSVLDRIEKLAEDGIQVNIE